MSVESPIRKRQMLCRTLLFPVTLQLVMLIWLAGCSGQSKQPEIPPQTLLLTKSDPVSTKSDTDQPRPEIKELPGIVRWATIASLSHDIAIMESVFWEPGDTDSLRARIFETPQIQGSRVLEIGTGSGLITLCCLQAGAANVVSTDLNPNAIQNVRFNAANFKGIDRLDARLVTRRDASAWSVVKPNEQFDFVISNPPWENNKPKSVEEFALYDPDFLLLDSLVGQRR